MFSDETESQEGGRVRHFLRLHVTAIGEDSFFGDWHRTYRKSHVALHSSSRGGREYVEGAVEPVATYSERDGEAVPSTGAVYRLHTKEWRFRAPPII